jgi:hypothetical protein
MRHAERTDEIVEIYHDLDEVLQATGASQAVYNFELTETGRQQREVATATVAATEALQEQDKAKLESAAMHAQYRAALELQQTKENERRAASSLLIKQESEALYALHQQLVEMGPALGDSAALMGQSLEAMLAQFSPVNQALGVFKEGAKGMAEGAMTSFVSAALSGEKVGKAFKKQMGDMLIAQGSAAILQGALAMIPFMPSFNPIGGTAYLAQGLLMVGAGKLMTGGKGGGKDKTLPATGAGAAPAPTTPAINNNSNVTVNNAFGIVGDQRQSARLVMDSLRFAEAEGL